MITFGVGAAFSQPVVAKTIYNNLNVSGAMAMATRPDSLGKFEIEAGDDFVVTTERFVKTATFIGILVQTVAAPTISGVDAEIDRVFPPGLQYASLSPDNVSGPETAFPDNL